MALRGNLAPLVIEQQNQSFNYSTSPTLTTIPFNTGLNLAWNYEVDGVNQPYFNITSGYWNINFKYFLLSTSPQPTGTQFLNVNSDQYFSDDGSYNADLNFPDVTNGGNPSGIFSNLQATIQRSDAVTGLSLYNGILFVANSQTGLTQLTAINQSDNNATVCSLLATEGSGAGALTSNNLTCVYADSQFLMVGTSDAGVFIAPMPPYYSADNPPPLGALTFVNYNSSNGLSSNYVLSVHHDISTGTFLVGTQEGTAGLNISTSAFGTAMTWSNAGIAQGLENAIINACWMYNGNIYVGTDAEVGISQDGGTTFTSYTTENGLGGSIVYALYVDSTGVYAGTVGGFSISTFLVIMVFTNKTTSDGLPNNVVLSIAKYDTDTIAVGTQDGPAVSFDGGDSFANAGTAVFVGAHFNAIAFDSTGQYIVGGCQASTGANHGGLFVSYLNAGNLTLNVSYLSTQAFRLTAAFSIDSLPDSQSGKLRASSQLTPFSGG